MTKVTISAHTESYEEKNGKGFVTFDGNKIIGRVMRGDKILHTQTVITDDSMESVCFAEECVVFNVKLWAVENTDFIIESDCLPQ